MFNIWRVVCHLGGHPSDFGKMYYKDGKRPFWYIDDDEYSDIVKTRPNSPLTEDNCSAIKIKD